MEITRLTQEDQFAELESSWDLLNSRSPLCSWQWLRTWWEHYRADRELYLLVVRDLDGSVLGIAPWFLGFERGGQRTVQLLGSGEVCSDDVGILAAPEHEARIADAISDWLVEASQQPGPDQWDQIDWPCVAAGDTSAHRLLANLSRAGCQLDRRPDVGLWRVPLPESWDAYVAQFSKNRRKRLRGYDRTIRELGLTLHIVQDPEELQVGLDVLLDLHQKRRESLGESSGFSSATHLQFVRNIAPGLLASGQLELVTLRQDGRAIAVEFVVVDDQTTYLYQSGLDPTIAEVSPGNLIVVAVIQRALALGRRKMDFMRGDEPYKASWGAQRESTERIRIAAKRLLPQVHQSIWRAGATVKDLVKTGLQYGQRS